jgi:hypothetical protein
MTLSLRPIKLCTILRSPLIPLVYNLTYPNGDVLLQYLMLFIFTLHNIFTYS